MGTQPGQGAANPIGTFLPIVLIFGVMYFFMIRPQMKKQKEHTNMLASLEKGDKIVTSGGIFGKIVGVKENAFTIEIGKDNKIDILKSAVSQKLES
ncbi:MAG: preprotein translocase subunit YajC [Deferribacteres bacterium]|nr:preprotein translocase subunit YajC [candidate division KSB1 bacterium]MCB9502334.1 preprotein translocase subunit YajC [Deferribacteres bacterium]